MKILLIGEYSRLHNSLKEGLIKLGHEVILIGTGDGFKNYPVDIDIKSKIAKSSSLKFIAKSIYKTLNINIIQIENTYRFKKILSNLKGFDVVQLINESAIKSNPNKEIKLLKKLIAQNNKVFLLSCGTDYMSVKFANDKKFRYSILTPYLNDNSLKNHFKHVLKYLSLPYIKLHEFIFKNIEGVIASDLDYHIPLKEHPKYLGLIPNPINFDKLGFQPLLIHGKINIFHGINTSSYIKKGNVYFDEALKIIQKKHGDKVNIVTTTDIPYSEYISLYNECHILLDQVFAYDQGYNALEAMAKGKVVFTGAEQEWLEYYHLAEDTVAINALPDAEKIAKKIEWLIFHPEKITEISKNARSFIEKEHDYVKIAKKYIQTWEVNN